MRAEATTRLSCIVAILALAVPASAAETGNPPAPPSSASVNPVASSTPLPGTYAEGFLAGDEEARRASMAGWGAGGFASGLFCAVPGCLGATGLGYILEPRPKQLSVQAIRSDEWKIAYQNSYAERTQQRRAKAALIGGSIGTAVLATALVVLFVEVNRANSSHAGD